MLIVMHPHLEYVPFDTQFHAKLLDCCLVMFLDPPAELLCKTAHFVLLLLRELGSEPLLHNGHSHLRSMKPMEAAQVMLLLIVFMSGPGAEGHYHLRRRPGDHPRRTSRGKGQWQGTTTSRPLSAILPWIIAIVARWFSLNFSSVEIPVTVASCTFECL